MNMNIALAGMGAAALFVAAPVVAVMTVGDDQGPTQHPTHETGRSPSPETPRWCNVPVHSDATVPCAHPSGERATPYRTAGLVWGGHACPVIRKTGRRVCTLQ